MAYKKSIETDIRELFKNAPEGYSEHYLEQHNQQDVADTVNYLASANPKQIQTTLVDYSNKTPIPFTK
ncbi:hypothetical protein [Carnobacterium maltaromaticum]|uniref:hypothetical protein n=1 Tax=Carnobacterium maltaromaticum TaxID=2751 RepID=UPI0039BE4213